MVFLYFCHFINLHIFSFTVTLSNIKSKQRKRESVRFYFLFSRLKYFEPLVSLKINLTFYNAIKQNDVLETVKIFIKLV